MLTETIQLEKLRQKIEDVEYEAGSQSDYLDRGKPSAKEARQAQESINTLNEQTKALQAELKDLIASLRSRQPQAIDEWINYHTGILQRIVEEQATDRNATTRRFVAKNTLAEWEKVRAGEQDFVRINWHFLKDYREGVRKIGNKAIAHNSSKIKEQPASDGKAWWQFWK
jgi:hypothetical protein